MSTDTFKEFLTDVLVDNRNLEEDLAEYKELSLSLRMERDSFKRELDDERQMPKMRWIHCAEELPMEGRQVITCDEDGYRAILVQWRGHWNCFVDSDGYLNTNNEMQVVAWMPLPTPYKAEEAE